MRRLRRPARRPAGRLVPAPGRRGRGPDGDDDRGPRARGRGARRRRSSPRTRSSAASARPARSSPRPRCSTRRPRRRASEIRVGDGGQPLPLRRLSEDRARDPPRLRAGGRVTPAVRQDAARDGGALRGRLGARRRGRRPRDVAGGRRADVVGKPATRARTALSGRAARPATRSTSRCRGCCTPACCARPTARCPVTRLDLDAARATPGVRAVLGPDGPVHDERRARAHRRAGVGRRADRRGRRRHARGGRCRRRRARARARGAAAARRSTRGSTSSASPRTRARRCAATPTPRSRRPR